MPDELTNTIKDNAASPAEAAVDGQSVKQHPLRDQIEADRYLSSREASKKRLGIRMTKVVPPGAS